VTHARIAPRIADAIAHATMPVNAEFLDFAIRMAQNAGAAILPHFRERIDIEDKGDPGYYDPVTIADRDAEAAIRADILERYPDHGIHGEEHGAQSGRSRYTWVIDPIDGTRSFILGQMHWATLIALNDGERPIVGVAHQPYVGETFTGTAGGIAQWRRGGERRRLAVRRCAQVEDAVLACTDPAMFRTQAERASFDRVASRARLTRWGGDCYAYCLLAMGLIDIVVETSLGPYDIQALMPIIEAAGGTVTAWDGGSCQDGGSVVACGDRALHPRVLGLLAG
jgi:myo-inositol-1(or 4)-monophosphatase